MECRSENGGLSGKGLQLSEWRVPFKIQAGSLSE
jgi:hypothetical protein